MSDILIPTKPVTKFNVLVKRAGESEGTYLYDTDDHLVALRAINRANFARGHRTGDLYYIEEVAK